jgi:hypothetical protein
MKAPKSTAVIFAPPSTRVVMTSYPKRFRLSNRSAVAAISERLLRPLCWGNCAGHQVIAIAANLYGQGLLKEVPVPVNNL